MGEIGLIGVVKIFFQETSRHLQRATESFGFANDSAKILLFFQEMSRHLQRATESFGFANDSAKTFGFANDLLVLINCHAKVGDERDFCKKDE